MRIRVNNSVEEIDKVEYDDDMKSFIFIQGDSEVTELPIDEVKDSDEEVIVDMLLVSILEHGYLDISRFEREVLSKYHNDYRQLNKEQERLTQYRRNFSTAISEVSTEKELLDLYRDSFSKITSEELDRTPFKDLLKMVSRTQLLKLCEILKITSVNSHSAGPKLLEVLDNNLSSLCRVKAMTGK